jgi:hypothetical protein
MPEIGGYRRTWIDHTSEVEAPLGAVMALLSDLDQWPAWTPGLSAIERDTSQPVRVGTRFTMRVKPAPFHPPLPLRCKVYRLEPSLIEWGGDALASSVRHRFALSELSATRTRVHQVEYATNVLAVIARIAEPGILKYDLRWQNALGTRLAA